MTSLHADEAFLDHYQLSHDPFAPRVPGFKFFPAQRKPVLGQLHHLARYSQLMLVVSGPLGSGKSLLRQALVASTNKQAVQSVVVSARSASDASSMLAQVAQELGVAQPEVQAILSKVVQLALTGQEVYLLVDDAEQLDESALQALLELAAGVPEGRPHVFLFGEPSLIAGLDELNVEEERFHIIELAPYSEEETREYLEQRLEGAGRGIEVFSREQIADIHENSDGWPGNINQVARDTLIETMIASRSTAKRPTMGFKMPTKHVLALSAVVVVAVAAAVLMPKKGDKAPAEAPAAQAQLPLGDGKQGAAIEFSGSSQPMPLPLVGQSQPVMREPLAQAAGMGEGEEGSPAGDTALQPGNPPPTVTTIAPPQGVPAGPAPAQPVAPAPKPVATQPVKPVAPVKPAPAPTQVAVAKPAPKAAEKPAAASAGNGGWYAGQKPGNYVVQILGTSSEASAQAYVKAQGGDYRYFKKTLQGKPLYVVTYGSFANRDAAVAAIKNLPAKVQAGKPWPRTVASVQQELAAAR
ncbi:MULTISPECIES: AAA family ATPase [unclassified Pseudomonas]|uniref:SPOR domain-containing protein n=1 Tax=unclassified Pseudomonas TaxID=196821 RepID=UPI001AE8CD0A|nr:MULTISPECIES: AAA family ATPase [unclassified Pseudomonas]WHH51495.1 SPOR domain-containing protein [Pseudomonas sp. Ap32]HDS1696728.1 SPOR domain-containing protein [Pseudomonas putida]MBP2274441.1 DamX protein [Pseudomonas sp. BP6]MBP2286588.1 DamX protein [Pseudomonas sp. BP7]HDS1701675.1 SPOR domain-containing protein [Pseudomonas putida]